MAAIANTNATAMVDLSQLSCDSILQSNGTNVPQPQGNADVAGIGVILSYFLTAYFTLIMTFVGYVFGLIPKEMINNADRNFYRVKSSQSPQWHKALEKGVCAFSDQQIVTGVAIMVAGFSTLPSIDVYHWQLLVYLGWMSSNTHLTTLTMLRDYFRARPFLSAIRLVGMSILLILLLAAFAPTANRAWTKAIIPHLRGGISSPGAPARCFFDRNFYRGVTRDAPFAYLILIIAFAWKAASLFLGDKLAGSLKKRPLNFLGRELVRQSQVRSISSSRNDSFLTRFRFRVTLATYIGLVALADFLQSFAASLWALIILLVWGTIVFTGTRNGGSAWMKAQENGWGYGQILPMLLLALPLVAVWEHFYKNKGLRTPGMHACAQLVPQLHDKETGRVSGRPVSERTEEVEVLIDAAHRSYQHQDKDSLMVLPDTLAEYVEAAHRLSSAVVPAAPEPLDHDVVAEQYLYRSRFFLSLLAGVNAVLLAGSCLVLVTEGLLIFQVARFDGIQDFRGNLWLPVAGLAAGAAVLWMLWFAAGMCLSELFRLRTTRRGGQGGEAVGLVPRDTGYHGASTAHSP